MRPRRSTSRLSADPAAQPARLFENLVRTVEEYRPADNVELLRRAYAFSAQHHGSQRRVSGDLFLSHPLAVVQLLADLRLDVNTLCAGLLHDTVEDARVSLDVLQEQFGDHVARLVEGVTKISRLDFSTQEVEQAQNLRKMVLAMVDDVRVILIKLADRLHNMRTVHFLPADKRQRVARETLEIYAPIAHRLGMGKIRGELEDLAFAVLEAEAYEQIRSQLEDKRKLNERFLADVQEVVAREVEQGGIPAVVEGRIKRTYSIYQKMKRSGVQLDQIYDLLAVRVITDSVKNCYAALGLVHQLWRPVPGRFKDYIGMPRPNLYQSLHTSIIHHSGQPFEVQIRTQEMHRVAEQGIAAHWRYKDSEEVTAADQERIAWLRSLIEWVQEMQDPSEFLSTLKVDLYPEEVYTFTPRGKVIVLPRQATPLDFAYAIHTEVGHRCVGAKVNGRLVPLRYALQNGDIVEILTQKDHTPTRDWLNLVRTSRARNKIQHWIRTQERQQARELGQRLLEKEARRHGLHLGKFGPADWERAVREYGCRQGEELLARIGFGKYAPRVVLARLTAAPLGEEARPTAPRRALAGLRETVRRVFRLRGEALSLRQPDLLLYRARCCNPIHGEEVVGYITRGRGIAVHTRICPNVQNLLYDSERRIEVEWAESEAETYPVRLAVTTTDRPGLLTEISGIIADDQCNIRHAEAHSDPSSGRAVIELIFDVREIKQFERIRAAINKVPDVHNVTRLLRV